MDWDDSVQTDTALILDIIIAMFASRFIHVNTPKYMFSTWNLESCLLYLMLFWHFIKINTYANATGVCV